MLGVLPFGENPDLSGTAGPAVPPHLPPCLSVISECSRECSPESLYVVTLWCHCLVSISSVTPWYHSLVSLSSELDDLDECDELDGFGELN